MYVCVYIYIYIVVTYIDKDICMYVCVSLSLSLYIYIYIYRYRRRDCNVLRCYNRMSPKARGIIVKVAGVTYIREHITLALLN